MKKLFSIDLFISIIHNKLMKIFYFVLLSFYSVFIHFLYFLGGMKKFKISRYKFAILFLFYFTYFSIFRNEEII